MARPETSAICIRGCKGTVPRSSAVPPALYPSFLFISSLSFLALLPTARKALHFQENPRRRETRDRVDYQESR